MKQKKKFRDPELTVHSTIGVNKRCYELLRKQKGVQEKSMMALVNELIEKAYGNETVQKV